MSIHPETTLGRVHYTVADLQRQVEFYKDVLGFYVLDQTSDSARLGTKNRELLRLTQVPGARRVRGVTGLYHTAFLVPTRRELAQLLRRLLQAQVPLQGTSDHGTHLAIYLPDPEGNGIELALDFPRERWPMRDGMMSLEDMPREGIDIEGLLGELEDDPSPWSELHPDTRLGHIHLHVANLESTEDFYHRLLGFDITVKGSGIGALFMSAGGYHHHIGTNVWKGVGLPPAPSDATGLRYFTVEMPNEDSFLDAVKRLGEATAVERATPNELLLKDPSQIGVLMTFRDAVR